MIRLYYVTYRLLPASYGLLKALAACHSLLRGLFSGIWLGLLGRETLLEINRKYYSSSNKYRDPIYNKSGLLPWESAMIATHFQNCKSILLVGAGGGREMAALGRLGYEVHGFECNPELVRAANALLASEGLTATVQVTPPDTCPTDQLMYDGLIVGWGAYMLIQGRDNRIALLRKMRAQARAGAPLLISFFFRSPDAKRFFVTMAIGNALRRLRQREKIELGDALEPEYVHYFTQNEIAGELREAGFALQHYGEVPYGHAVGIAS